MRNRRFSLAVTMGAESRTPKGDYSSNRSTDSPLFFQPLIDQSSLAESNTAALMPFKNARALALMMSVSIARPEYVFP